jgi:hypothetical protein
MNSTPEKFQLRAKLWREFVARYKAILILAPEEFPKYSAEFRERWLAGK